MYVFYLLIGSRQISKQNTLLLQLWFYIIYSVCFFILIYSVLRGRYLLKEIKGMTVLVSIQLLFLAVYGFERFGTPRRLLINNGKDLT